jgi:diaminohydroxyphosphoribosylaminopyrimidine deaminase / 5-amino-6-(5-phosphoribosylamino)uracil reductase
MRGEASMNDVVCMSRCLALAHRARGRTTPNPVVGAVIENNGEIVGEGWHLRAGAEHAEVMALRVAGEKARGSTLYVNLEPCCHFGRTPPCTDAILKAGVRRVVTGMQDPNPLVNGQGIAQLEAAGVEVHVGVLEAECRAANEPFLMSIQHGRPLVVLKAGSSLDGYIATVAGESSWITGEDARAHAHELRNVADAVLVGARTAIADDPQLNCRMNGGRDPIPVVLDTELRVPESARMFHGSCRAIVFTAREPRSGHPAEVVRVQEGSTGLDLGAVTRELNARGVQTLLVEGGAAVHRAFLEAGIVDRIYLYLSPKILGGGRSWVGGPGLRRLADAWCMSVARTERLGDDILLVLEPEARRS